MLKVDAAHQKDLAKPPQSQFESFSRDNVPLNKDLSIQQT